MACFLKLLGGFSPRRLPSSPNAQRGRPALPWSERLGREQGRPTGVRSTVHSDPYHLPIRCQAAHPPTTTWSTPRGPQLVHLKGWGIPTLRHLSVSSSPPHSELYLLSRLCTYSTFSLLSVLYATYVSTASTLDCRAHRADGGMENSQSWTRIDPTQRQSTLERCNPPGTLPSTTSYPHSKQTPKGNGEEVLCLFSIQHPIFGSPPGASCTPQSSVHKSRSIFA